MGSSADNSPLSEKIKVGKFISRDELELNHFVNINDVKDFIKKLKEEMFNKMEISQEVFHK